LHTNTILKELCRYAIGTYADIIYRNAILHADREAFIDRDIRVTFREYNVRVNRLIHALQEMGLKKGDVIGILSWNCLAYVDIYGAAMKGGYIASPFNPRLQAEELEYIINYSEASVLFVGPELVEVVEAIRGRLPGVRHFVSMEGVVSGMTPHDALLAAHAGDEPDVLVQEDDPVAIIYTSGTTGVPRGALYTHRRFMEDSKNRIIDTGMIRGDRHILVSPLFHIAGNTYLRAALFSAGCCVIVKFFDPAATLRMIQQERATHIELVPTHIVAMLNIPDLETYDVSSMKLIWYAASPMPLEVIRKAVSVFGPIFSQGYGQTESGPLITHLSKEDHDVLDKTAAEQKKLLSIGQPDIGLHVRIVDEKNDDVGVGDIGEIIVQGKQIMAGYWRRPEETEKAIVDGWLHTGDMGYYDDEGYIFIADRKKDMIITGGENVYPREVEDVFYQHPSVLEVAVIGAPDPYWVERVHAVVVLKKGATATAEELTDFCRGKIARYKAPKSMEFVDALPKNASGKILKREIRKRYWTNSKNEE